MLGHPSFISYYLSAPANTSQYNQAVNSSLTHTLSTVAEPWSSESVCVLGVSRAGVLLSSAAV